MRVGIIALLHESNTFVRAQTTLRHFRDDLLATGEDVRTQLVGSNHEVGGMFEGLSERGIDAVPLLAARAIPYGPIAADAFAALIELMYCELDRVGDLDGLLVAPHGATVREGQFDADGEWLSAVRRRVPASLPIIGTLDPHANLSAAMLEATDALIAYRTNPHLDQRDRGREAALLMARTLAGEIRPTQAAAFPPIAINIERQNTTEEHWRPLYELADQMLEQPGVLSNSIVMGFPYADVPEMGSAALVVTDNDRATASRLANQLGQGLWDHRENFVGKMIDTPDAVTRCLQLPQPVCLLDMGDNVGGGSPADGTVLAHELRKQEVSPSLVCLCDPESVERAIRHGIGRRIRFAIGSRADDRQGSPFEDDFLIASVHEGRFREPQPRHGGFSWFDQGTSVVLIASCGITFLVTSLRVPPFSLRQLTSCGIDPTAYTAIVAKGVSAPVVAYAPVCPTMLRVNTPGTTCADLERLEYRHRRRPLFPFER